MPSQMQDVAVRAGVSVTTVSHVLNGTRAVAQATRERVLAAAHELNYYKNSSARLLARGRSDCYGLLISDIENPFFPELIKSFEIACLESGMEVLLATTNYDTAQARKAVGRMIESKVSGVAVMTSQLDRELIEELVTNGTPMVRLDGGKPGHGRSTVSMDYVPGSRRAVRHLASLGHRRLGFISGPLDRVSAVSFRDAILRAASEAGLPKPRLIESQSTPDSGGAAVREWMARGELPTAILCGNDLCALGVMGAIFEAGLQVPADVSVIGADDILFARFSHPPLTTIRFPRDVLG